MKNVLPIVVLVVALCLAGWTGYVQAQKNHAATNSWEYQELQLSSGQIPTARLNALGTQGWELVTVTPCPAGTACQFTMFLKRPR